MFYVRGDHFNVQKGLYVYKLLCYNFKEKQNNQKKNKQSRKL